MNIDFQPPMLEKHAKQMIQTSTNALFELAHQLSKELRKVGGNHLFLQNFIIFLANKPECIFDWHSKHVV